MTDTLADVKQIAAAAGKASWNKLQPIGRYTIRFFELMDIKIDKVL
jgi:hypothetical protein